MLVQNIVENVSQIFPSLKEAQTLKKIDYAQKKYAAETRVLKTSSQLTDIDSNVTFTLPTDCKEITDITFYSATGMPVYMDDLGLSYEIVFGEITFLNNDGTLLSNLPSTIDTAYLDYVYIATDITATTGVLEVPEELHDGIMAYLWKDLYSTFNVEMTIEGKPVMRKDWNAVRYWAGEYANWVKEGKKWSETNQDNIDSFVRVDVLGNPIRLARQKTQ